MTPDNTTERNASLPSPEDPATDGATNKRRGRGKSQERKRSHEGTTIEFRVFPEEAAKLKERAAEASMSVSEFCRRASSGKRIVSRYDYDVIRRLAELHGDQARLGNLFKMALDQDEGRGEHSDIKGINSVLLKIEKNQDLITRILMEVNES